jgi:hypothetical protein
MLPLVGALLRQGRTSSSSSTSTWKDNSICLQAVVLQSMWTRFASNPLSACIAGKRPSIVKLAPSALCLLSAQLQGAEQAGASSCYLCSARAYCGGLRDQSRLQQGPALVPDIWQV